MIDLIAIVLPSKVIAREARNTFINMQHEHLVELNDSVIAYKNEKGQVKLDQTVNLAAVGGFVGGFWGLFLGILFAIPFGAAIVPIIVSVFGASIGALAGANSDFGINDDMMKDLSQGLDSGKVALFVLVRNATTKNVIEHLKQYNGKVLKTSLPHEMEDKLKQVLNRSKQTG